MALLRVAPMTKAGQTCLTTCKIPMNERNLRRSPTLEAASRGARARASTRNSTSSVIKFLDLKKLASPTGGIKGGDPGRNAMPRDNVFSGCEQRPVIHTRCPLSLHMTYPNLSAAFRALFDSDITAIIN